MRTAAARSNNSVQKQRARKVRKSVVADALNIMCQVAGEYDITKARGVSPIEQKKIIAETECNGFKVIVTICDLSEEERSKRDSLLGQKAVRVLQEYAARTSKGERS
jgi:hypothetical protein